MPNNGINATRSNRLFISYKPRARYAGRSASSLSERLKCKFSAASQQLLGNMRILQPKRKLQQSFILAALLSFLVLSGGLWLSLDSSWAKGFYFLVFLIPNYICVEWLGSQIFSEELSLRISGREFSVVRIIAGVLLMLAVYGVSFGLAILGKRLLVL